MSVTIFQIGRLDVTKFDMCTFDSGLIVASDGLKIGESVIKTVDKVLSDGSKIGDPTFVKTVTIGLTDGLRIGESIAKTVTKVLQSGLKIGEKTLGLISWIKDEPWKSTIDIWQRIHQSWLPWTRAADSYTKESTASDIWVKDARKTTTYTKSSSGSGPTWTK